jgi:hypothetical protein
MPSKDRSKNLAWLVVGPRGDKRLIKRYVCLEMERREGVRARGQARGSNRRSMAQNKGASMATGANLTTLGHEEVTDCEEMEEGDEREEEEPVLISQTSGRGRGRPPAARAGYRKRRGGDAELGREAEPPAKH